VIKDSIEKTYWERVGKLQLDLVMQYYCRKRLWWQFWKPKYSPLSPPTPSAEEIEKFCAVKGCRKPSIVKGMCCMHYTRLRRGGSVGEPQERVHHNKRAFPKCEHLPKAYNSKCCLRCYNKHAKRAERKRKITVLHHTHHTDV